MKSRLSKQKALALTGALIVALVGVVAYAGLGAQPALRVAAAGRQDEERGPIRPPRGCPQWAKPTIINRNAQTPTTPAPFIADFLQKITKGQNSLVRKYGQPGTDLQFADSFALGGCRLCAATLEFEVKKESGQWNNDALHLWLEPDTIPNVAPPPLFTTGANLWGMFPNGHPVIEWVKSPTSPQRPIAELNSYISNSQLSAPAISAYIQDDTSIKSGRLTLWHF